MESKIEHSVAPPKLSLFEFKTKFTDYMKVCQIFKLNSEKRISELELNNDHDALIKLHEQMKVTIREQITVYQGKLKEAEYYEEETLQERITNEIARQNRYLENLQLQLLQIKSLKFLFSLSPFELFQEALKNKSSALLLITNPKLIAKISNNQMLLITHQDPEIIKSLASIVSTREYTFETPNFFAALKQHVHTKSDEAFIVEKENAAIRDLLLKINSYLDKKIEEAVKANAAPWALGYFGSRHQLDKGDKKVSVPQGIYELKSYLEQRDKIPASDVLIKMQNTLKIKNAERKDESMFQQFKRLISYLFGYAQSEETLKEYEYLEQVTIGKRSIS
ncbi:hypothetical protein [Legionella parisiensis]|uniref:Uncharacterized protein n=1 Tax=Legionella parisiensis TaxID=45071 RepID=A0A1E5JTD8_9GAMM|nr:hypothetical protein [Legionella parisiensis]KTD40390.1 hypothetical protein Lpar_1707 [Legionella parisiensis]OEH47799.1 hypothetical protein lpari_01177 [Legionella parisiensis]STX77176.1 Uncharacterised protein [Legionella parisiensis]